MTWPFVVRAHRILVGQGFCSQATKIPSVFLLQVGNLKSVSFLFIVLLVVGGCQQSSVSNEPQAQGCCGDGRAPSRENKATKIISHKLGKISGRTALKHNFQVRNTGDNTARLQGPIEVSYPRQCQATLDREEIPPGQTANLEIIYEPPEETSTFDIFVKLPMSGDQVTTQYHLSGQF